ncbi:hypothetical protein [Modestobacter versicolor]|uniref:hypothetical protein n=1 Tax=Modestobacter versicolor TaxID=429133 RepID=UPI0034DFBE40
MTPHPLGVPQRWAGPLPAADDEARTRRLIAARRWHRRAEQAARRAARARSAGCAPR